jgi:ABC-type multidrug transport system fused ATPase/permease subunit
MRYRKELDPVLTAVSFTVEPRQKIGIVGRTGAGKSSLVNALFRLVELESGTVKIDGVDVSQIGLQDLRSNIAIIPQDPVLFSGTIRTNLDPFNQHEDKELWDALERVKLKPHIQSLASKLESEVTDNGTNFSVGQRQLICMARAVLKNSKILVMDEATASVDTETDSVIQQTVRTEFHDRTVLTIAHRLNTIMDSDKILVMGDGKVLEMESPSSLLKSRGAFWQLVQSTGAASAEYLSKLATGELSIMSEM